MNYNDILKDGIDRLSKNGIAESHLDARLLFEESFGISHGKLLLCGHDEVDLSLEENKEKYDYYFSLIDKRSERIPLQHILGYTEFMGLKFKVNENVLIPRQDTEILVEEALKNLHDGMRILDMCTGSGCILISLLNYSNCCSGVGADISKEALKVANYNACELLNNKESVDWKFVESDLFAEFSNEERFDMIISNPPYIATSVIDTLEIEVKMHDPMSALDGGQDGLEFYRSIIAKAGDYLVKGGLLYFEIGYDQGEAVERLLEENGYKEITIVKDYSGLDRVVFGHKSVM